MEKVYVRTFGCAQNCADSEIISGELKKAGFALTNKCEDADLVVVNSCTVKGPTENAVMKYVGLCRDQGKHIVVAGCLPQASPKLVDGFSIIGPSQVHRIAEVVEETLQGNTVTLLVNEKTQKLSLPRIRKSKAIEIIPLSSGCLGDCSYCIVRLARGVLVSYPKESILRRVREAVGSGISQIWLTSQDTGCYGFDEDDGYLLPDLLKEICSVPGEFRVRLGMANPDHIQKCLPDLIDAFRHEKMYKFLHIPVQSGSDEILKQMRRKYSRQDFVNIVERIRNAIPEISIATDVIAGFPGETEAQFTETIELLKEIRPDVVNRSRFWKRPGTKAEKMKGQILSSRIKDRSRYLSSVFERISYENNRKWRGWQGTAVIESAGKEGSMVARNDSYKPIIIMGQHKLGARVAVRIDHSTVFDLRGTLTSR